MEKNCFKAMSVHTPELIACLSLIISLSTGCDVQSDNGSTQDMSAVPDFTPRRDMPDSDMSPEQDAGVDMTPIHNMDMSLEGKGSLTFKATFGSNFPNQIPASWRTPLGVQNQNDAFLVLMLCELEDTLCMQPVVVRELTADAPVQGSFGPDVSVDMLPEGSYLAMIFLDSERSRTRGFDWASTPARTNELAWGGYVSEFDIMMSHPDDSPAMAHNPPPTPIEVNLSSQGSVDLGTLRLAHFHERRVDPVPETEEGTLIVATETGLRMIELESFEVADTGGGFRDYLLTDREHHDFALKGDICGMVKGADSTLYVLFRGLAGAGFAVPFDAKNRTQIGEGYAINFPGGAPCKGIYHEHDGQQFLFLINKGASGVARAKEGMWYVSLDDDMTQDTIATQLLKEDDDLFGLPFNDIAAHQNHLYITTTPGEGDRAHVPSETIGQHTVFKSTFDVMGRPEFSTGGVYDFWTPMPSKDGIVGVNGAVDCITPDQQGGTQAGLYAARFHDGRELLFVGGCSRIAAFDLELGERVDLVPSNPRSMDINATLFGHKLTEFSLSPDGDILYIMPQYKSQFHFYFQLDNDPSERQTYNRYMILPLALDQGDVPALHPNFTGDDIDAHEGTTSIGDGITPANDPGIDVNHAHLTRYQVNWVGSLAGSSNQSSSIATGPTLTAGRRTLWVRGSGTPGVSGLGKGSNLMTYSVTQRRAHLWSHNQDGYEWDFYHVWQGGNESNAPFGFDLTPENDAALATYGVLFMD